MVVEIGGCSISHFLSGHKHEIPTEYKKEPPMIISEDLIEKIYRNHQTEGNKWKKISNKIEEEMNVAVSPKIIGFKSL